MDRKMCLFCKYFDAPFHCTIHDIGTESDSSCGRFQEADDEEVTD